MVRAKRLKPSAASKHLVSSDQAVTGTSQNPLSSSDALSPAVTGSANLRPDAKARTT